jgi:RNA polymerase sigma factor (sigma-70 family)
MIEEKDINENLEKIKIVALNMTRDEDDAKDLLQETAIKALKNIDKYNPQYGQVTTWLCTIMRNLYIDTYRKKKKRSIFINDTNLNEGEGLSDNMILEPNKNGGYQNIKYEEIMCTIIDTDTISETDKQLFLKQLEGYKLKEMTEMFDLNINTVKGRLRNVKIEMQRLLTEKGIR